MNYALIVAAIGVIAFGWLFQYSYSLKQQCRKAQAKAASLEDEATRLWTTQSELSKEAQRLQAEVDRLAEENRTFGQRSNVVQSLEAAKAKLEQVNATLAQRNSDLSNLEKTVAQQQAALAHLKTAGGKLQASYTALQQKHQLLKEQITSLNRALHSLQQKINQSQANCQSLEKTRLTLEDRCNHLQSDISNSEQEKRDLNIQISQLRDNIKHFKAENNRIEEEHLRVLEERGQYLELYPNLVRQKENLQQALEVLEQEKQNLSTQLTEAIAQAESELQGRRRIQIISACHQHSTSEQGLFHAKIDMNFSRVREALDFAEVMFRDVLEVWESARDSADSYNFIRPDKAYSALQSLAWFGQYYFEQDRSIGNNLYDFLKEHYNLECSGESKTVKNDKKLRGERCFRNGNQQKEMFHHIKLGGGDGANKILRIYFAINCESQKLKLATAAGTHS